MQSLVNVSAPVRRNTMGETNLLSVLERCHDHVYANDGLPKDVIFRDITYLLLAKIIDEGTSRSPRRFSVTSEEYVSLTNGNHGDHPGREFEERLSGLLREVAIWFPRINHRALQLQLSSIAYIVKCLQAVSLSSTPYDVKGIAYQAFFSAHHRGARGEFFTPGLVVDLAMSLNPPREGSVVLDPACGSAGFLAAVRDRYGDNFRFIGVDINPNLIEVAELNATLHGISDGDMLTANALRPLAELSSVTDGTISAECADYIYTNPPFGTHGRVRDGSILREFELGSADHVDNSGQLAAVRIPRSSQTPEVLFVERCIQLLKPGGRLSIVLPIGIAANASLGYVREFITDTCEVLSVVSLPDGIFGGTGTNPRSMLLTARKRDMHASGGVTLLYRMKHLPKDESTMGLVFGSLKESAGHRFGESIKVSEISGSGRFDPAYWLAQHGKGQGQTSGPRLGEVVELITERAPITTLGRPDGFMYADISSVDPMFGTIQARQVFPREVPSRARKMAHAGDMLVSLVRPDRGAIAIVPDDLDGCVVSTGFAVLRCRALTPRYLWALLKTESVAAQMADLCTASMYPTLGETDLLSVRLPSVCGADAQAAIEAEIETAQRMWQNGKLAISHALSVVTEDSRRHVSAETIPRDPVSEDSE